MKVVDGAGLILGRVATHVAKMALEGERVVVVNCEKMILTGSKEGVFKKFKERRERGNPHWGPYYPRMSDRIVRRTIRGMLPYKKDRGRNAFRRVNCYLGVPKDIKEKPETIKSASYTKLRTTKFIELGVIAKLLGGK